ncbi:hypothetical protein SAMN02745751_01887 [Dethiosulfatibacter aminovorans DSM 17477]|uniref:DUF5666 domain-containing protein n=1 Tax=Dethiosulfatibacter aminovorans DSM 17477 TaxID=1121476 RepID=A0A1M6H262_9FIRM|nr:hypothetical protein [Dethiosulfatibacter aminovorans]SHJ16214.1 hypothetical protein SAMN02745751_01887 [Dethiosulfatibacter aminovorans DSM 17477]
MKKIAIITLLFIVIATMGGCQNSSGEQEIDKPEELETPSEENNEGAEEGYNTSPTDDIKEGETITRGEIMQFEGEYIHIISGDIVEVFEYDQRQENDFYLGQEVSLIKGDGFNTLEPVIKDDFKMTYNNMGMPIDTISGEVIGTEEKTLMILSNNTEVTFKTYETANIEEGTNITVFAMSLDKDLQTVITILNEDSKLSLTVTDIQRGENGEMLLSMKDVDDGEYIVNASGCMLELNMSEIALGDELTVYHNGVMESWPMQVDTVMLRK